MPRRYTNHSSQRAESFEKHSLEATAILLENRIEIAPLFPWEVKPLLRRCRSPSVKRFLYRMTEMKNERAQN
ncbi:hypothetical protein CLV24_104182 [Pontibacter ummariensis]|uniref:Uncharacterized protein n=1 Tax=Pontibacter ummariensis TaxID=1610492 RepID=A0A239DF72_9BACT|nr:hypothetical protein CLV24_104182 [Pontibacter ummariensis]SNS30403.1 hypothetical protein SAMN06296052_104181 [Pontibacter ummariensis]